MSKLSNQTNLAFEAIDCITSGMSRHDAKEHAKEVYGVKTWHDMGQTIGIYKIQTKGDYKQIATQATEWIKENYQIHSIREITGSQVYAWLESKLDDGLAYASLRTYASGLEKFSVAIERWTEKPCDWSAEIQEFRDLARAVYGYGRELKEPRAFENPQAVIENIDEDNKLYAELQYECGVRINEIHTIKIDSKGDFSVVGKGSYARTMFPFTDELKNAIQAKLDANGTVGLETKAEQDEYRNAIRDACEIAGEKYTGSHAFRHNFAQEHFQQFVFEGKGYNESLRATSELLGHHREDVVEKYYLR